MSRILLVGLALRLIALPAPIAAKPIQAAPTEAIHRCDLGGIAEALKLMDDFKTKEGFKGRTCKGAHGEDRRGWGREPSCSANHEWLDRSSEDTEKLNAFAVKFRTHMRERYLGNDKEWGDGSDKDWGEYNRLCEHSLWRKTGNCQYRVWLGIGPGEYSAADRYILSDAEKCLNVLPGIDEAFLGLDQAANAAFAEGDAVLQTAQAMGLIKIREMEPGISERIREGGKGLRPVSRKVIAMALPWQDNWHGGACPYALFQAEPSGDLQEFRDGLLTLLSPEAPAGSQDAISPGEAVQAYFLSLIKLKEAVLSFGQHAAIKRDFQFSRAPAHGKPEKDTQYLARGLIMDLAAINGLWGEPRSSVAPRDGKFYEQIYSKRESSPANLSSVDWSLRNRLAAQFREIYDVLFNLQKMVLCECMDTEDKAGRPSRCLQRLLAGIDKQIVPGDPRLPLRW